MVVSASQARIPHRPLARAGATEPGGRRIGEIVKTLLLKIVGLYRWMRPALGGARCRFYPSCSQYAHDAIVIHGAGRGSYLAVRRIAKCHPFHPGGLDPVPERI